MLSLSEPRKTEVELIKNLADNIDILLAAKDNQVWLVPLFHLLLSYLKANSKNFTGENFELIKRVFSQLERLKVYLCPIAIEPSEKNHSHIMRFYDLAIQLAERLNLQGELDILKRSRVKFQQRSFIREATENVIAVPPDSRTLLDGLKEFSSQLLAAERAHNDELTAELTCDISELETQYILQIAGIRGQTLEALKKLAFKLYQHKANIVFNVTEGLEKIFLALGNKRMDTATLEVALELSNLILGKIDLTKTETREWMRYRTQIKAARKHLKKEATSERILLGQAAYSEKMRALTKVIIDECIELLGTPPHRICFLILGSMSRQDMQPYSDLEYALLEDGSINPEYTANLLKLIEFKITSIGEYSLSSAGEEGSAGFHLDEGGHPGDAGVAVRLRGTPEQVMARCKTACAANWEGLENIGQINISFSLFHADYLCGNKELWKLYQQQLTVYLNQTGQELAERYIQLQLAEFNKAAAKTGMIEIKNLITAPLIYLCHSLKLYYLPVISDLLAAHQTLAILRLLEENKILHPDFVHDIAKTLATTQLLRYQKQLQAGRQLKPELTEPSDMLNEISQGWIRAIYHNSFRIFRGDAFEPLLMECRVLQQMQADKDVIPSSSSKEELSLLVRYKVRALTTASLAQWKDYYLQLPIYLRAKMLQNIDQLETPEKAEQLWRVLGKYPAMDGMRFLVVREEGRWHEQLTKLFADAGSKSPAKITISVAGKEQTGILRHEIYQLIWDSEKNKLRPKQGDGNHLVIPVNFSGVSFHFKFYPENPGYEIAVEVLHQLIIGHGTSKAVLARLEMHGVMYPLLISQTVPGKNLNQELHDHLENLLILDAKHYSQLFLMTLLIQPEDGKPDNYILQKITAPDGTKTQELVAIDNDHAFIQPSAEAVLGGLWSAKKIFTKTIIYCLDQLKQPLHPEAIDEFLLLNPKYVLEIWLGQLRVCAKSWERLFKPEENMALATRKPEESLVRLRLPPGLTCHLYQQFSELQEIIRSCQEYQTAITPMKLLKRKNTTLAVYYQELCCQHSTPKLRFATLAAEYYVRVGDRHRSQVNSTQMITLSFGMKTTYLRLAAQDRYTIDSARRELNEIADRYNKLGEMIAHLESGNAELIQGILRILQKSEAKIFILRIINALDFTKIALEYQTKILLLLKDIKIDKLHLRHASALYDRNLCNILSSQTSLLMLQIEGCQNITELRLPFLSQLMSLRVIDCSNLQLLTGETKSTKLLPRLKILEIIDCPRLEADCVQLPVAMKRLSSYRFKDQRYYLDKCKAIIERSFAQFNSPKLNQGIILTLSEEIKGNKIELNHKSIKQIGEVINNYLLLMQKITSKIIPTLLNSSENSEWEVRAGGVTALGEVVKAKPDLITPEFMRQILTALLKSLEDSDSFYVQAGGATGLGEVVKAKPDLITLEFMRQILTELPKSFGDRSNDVRVAGAKALGKVAKARADLIIPEFMPQIISVLLESLGDSNSNIRIVGAKALGKMVKARADLIFPNFMLKILSALLKGLGDSNNNIRAAIAEVLIEMVKARPGLITQILPVLLKSLGDSNSDVREGGARTLGKVVNLRPELITQIISALLNNLENRYDDVRAGGATALGEIVKARPDLITPEMQPRILSALLNCLENSIKFVQASGAKALVEVVKVRPNLITSEFMRQILYTLLKSLGDRDDNIRAGGAIGLGELIKASPDLITPEFMRQILTALLKSLGDFDWVVLVSGATALLELIKARPYLATPEVVSQILSALLNNYGDDRYSLVRASEAKTLRELVKARPDLITPEFMRQILPVLLKSLGHNNSTVRVRGKTALLDLVKARPDLIIPKFINQILSAFLNSLENSEWEVRSGGAEALGEVIRARPDLITPKFMRQIHHALIKSLEDSDHYVRTNGVIALGEVVKARPDLITQILPALLNSLRDKVYYVQASGVTALGKLASISFLDLLKPTLSPLILESQQLVKAFGEQNPALPKVVIKQIMHEIAAEPRSAKSAALVCKTWHSFFRPKRERTISTSATSVIVPTTASSIPTWHPAKNPT